MAFSEEVKLQVKRKSDFRCVVCNEPIVEIHHIIPQEENGPDTIDNAVALCAHCHNIYGGNTSKREKLRQIRDNTYKRLEEEFKPKKSFLKVEKAEGRYKVLHEEDNIVLRCNVSAKENFNQAAMKIYKLIYNTQKEYPQVNRTLIVEIEGHRNTLGEYDHDMFELQDEFLMNFMLEFLHILHMPLISVKNPKIQKDLQSDTLMIFENKEEMIKAQEKLEKEEVEMLNNPKENK